jgi:poly(A) polymerase
MRTVEKIIYADGYFENHLRKAYEEHTGQIMANGHTRIQLIKLAALFHDIGKPKARWVDNTGRVRFRGHEIVGEEIMVDICDRLRLSEIEKTFLCKIVKEHMWPLTLYKTNDVSGRALYDLFKNFGEITLDIILIGLADIISTRQLLKPHEEMGMYKVHAEYLANNYLTRFKRLEDISDIINGNDILEKFQIEDKTTIVNIIDSVKKAIFFGKIPLERERILKYIEECLV